MSNLVLRKLNAFTHEQYLRSSVVRLFNREKRAFDEFTEINSAPLKANLDTIFPQNLIQ